MKSATKTLRLEVPGGGNALFAHLSAESALRFEMARLADWLAERGLDPAEDGAHGQACDQISWRCGYLAGLKQALAVLTGGDATAH